MKDFDDFKRHYKFGLAASRAVSSGKSSAGLTLGDADKIGKLVEKALADSLEKTLRAYHEWVNS